MAGIPDSELIKITKQFTCKLNKLEKKHNSKVMMFSAIRQKDDSWITATSSQNVQ